MTVRRTGDAPKMTLRIADGNGMVNVVKSWGKTRTVPASWELKVTPDDVWPMLDTVSEALGITKSDLIRYALVFAFGHERFRCGLEETLGQLDEVVFGVMGSQTLSVKSLVKRVLRKVVVVDNGIKSRTLWSKWIRLPVKEAQ